MQDNKTIIVLIGIIVGVVFAWMVQQANNPADNNEPAQNQTADPQNSTFLIEGLPVSLVNGESSVQEVAGSATKTVTKYFGAEKRGDFNGDTKEDVAFVADRNDGGSGTFYYLVALLSSDNGYKGAEAQFLGDRIAPQSTNYLNGEIIVNYLDRKTGEPMSTAPSVPAERYFTASGIELKETYHQMTETDARTIAEASCIKGGEALGPGAYDRANGTWSFDANLNATRLGCTPVCVVSADTKTATLDWRCSGATEGSNNGTPCTMEAKICPDGTAVGRMGPNCEFAPCPETSPKETECTPESRDADVCIQIYDPVCAWVQIQCIKAPCNPVQQTFSNSCEACKNKLVKSYIKGECTE